jgi:hypothetical protein
MPRERRRARREIQRSLQINENRMLYTTYLFVLGFLYLE